MNNKIRVGILFGGKSAEHEVSLQSAINVVNAIDKNKYDITLIGIGKDGRWYLNDTSKFVLHSKNPKLIKLDIASNAISIAPQSYGKISSLSSKNISRQIDVIFPILHGPFGEDGTIQGFLKTANIPFVGAGVLGSAVGMDKDVSKRLLRDAGIPIAKFVVMNNKPNLSFKQIKQKLGLPFFVKPANMGSSVGVSKVESIRQYKKALTNAFIFDRKVIAEEFIEGREIECSVVGNENPIASIPGEVIVHDTFYSYNAKYIDETGAELQIPANISKRKTKQVQELSIKTFKTLCGEGMARVDFFLKKNGNLIVNELNTIPGFTSRSMYPLLWRKSGLSYTKLIDKLIMLAIDRFQKEQKLKTSYS